LIKKEKSGSTLPMPLSLRILRVTSKNCCS
jgi:hypothetical protein